MTRPLPGTREWLIKHNVIDEHGVNATPRIRHCLHCGLAGWAAWVDGTGPTALVVPIALTPLGELQAIMAGRDTYTHWYEGIDLRTGYFIARLPASPTNIIRPGHDCGSSDQFEHYPQKPPQQNHHEGNRTNDQIEEIPF